MRALRALLLALLVAAPVAAEEPPSYGDAIVTGAIGDASRLLPILASDSASGDIVGLVFNGLVKYNEQLEQVGDLAESWTVSPDGRTITFRLRAGVVWQDGAPFSADDVRFTYETLIDPDVATPFSSNYELVESLETPDPLTVRVRYKEPFAPALESWGIGIMPKHLLAQEDLNTTTYLRAPIGTGPYRFHRWKTGELIELRAFPQHFEHRPFIDRYLYRVIPDQATLFLELLTGGVDTTSLTPLQYTRQADAPYIRDRYQKFRYPSFGFTYIGYNLADARFADVRIRRAFNLAIDKQAILNGVLFGLGAVATGPYPKESWAHDPSIAPPAPDAAAARRLLAGAGWEDRDGDGWLDKDGRSFSFTLLTNQGNEVRRQAAELIQRQLREVGVDVKIRIIEWSTFVHEFIEKRQFDAVLLAWSLGRDPDLYDLFHSSKIKPGEYNFIGYANPAVDALLIEGRRTFDREARARIYHQVHRALYEDQPYTFLYVSDALPVVERRFRNVRATPAGIGVNFIDWHVPPAERRYHGLEMVP